YLWLLGLFLLPFLIVAKISLSETVLAMPPYRPVLHFGDELGEWIARLGELSLDNYRFIFEDPLYLLSYLSSLRIAFFSTLLALLIGYPIAYGMAKAPL